MAKGISLSLKGFDKLLSQLEEAGKDVDAEAARIIKEDAEIVDTELKSACKSSNVPEDIINEITKTVQGSLNVYSAEVGWKLGNYNPKNPSAGYKAIFLNYGTVRRHTAKGYDRGEIPKKSTAQQFIAQAKKKAKTKISKKHKEMLKKMLGEIE
mgnify:CR=1 FL=1